MKGLHALATISTVCLSVMQLHCAKMAEWIKVLFEVRTCRYPRQTVLDGWPNPTAR